MLMVIKEDTSKNTVKGLLTKNSGIRQTLKNEHGAIVCSGSAQVAEVTFFFFSFLSFR